MLFGERVRLKERIQPERTRGLKRLDDMGRKNLYIAQLRKRGGKSLVRKCGVLCARQNFHEEKNALKIRWLRARIPYLGSNPQAPVIG